MFVLSWKDLYKALTFIIVANMENCSDDYFTDLKHGRDFLIV